jgi:hypothetical protein
LIVPSTLVPMRRRGGRWQPAAPGWGLVELSSGRPIDPPALVTDESVEMTDWELQDYGVQVVREHLKEAGRVLMSWQSNQHVDPSLWFVGDRGPEWVLVRVARMRSTTMTKPRTGRPSRRPASTR